MTKMTKREKYEALRALPEVQANAVLVEFIDHELELLSRKNVSNKKPTATQIGNEALKGEILAAMEETHLYTVSEMIKAFACCEGLSTPKVSALVNQMVEANVLDKVIDKRRSYFRIHEGA